GDCTIFHDRSVRCSRRGGWLMKHAGRNKRSALRKVLHERRRAGSALQFALSVCPVRFFHRSFSSVLRSDQRPWPDRAPSCSRFSLLPWQSPRASLQRPVPPLLMIFVRYSFDAPSVISTLLNTSFSIPLKISNQLARTLFQFSLIAAKSE